MNSALPMVSRETLATLAQVRSREELSAGLLRICAEIGTDSYLLIGRIQERGAEHAHILASNWVYDTISLAGIDQLDALAGGELSTAVGETPRSFDPAQAEPLGAAARGLGRMLREHGHREMCCLRLYAGTRRCRVLFSAERPGSIDVARLPAAQLACCYLISRLDSRLLGQSQAETLSDRERECLQWVSEGKTTDEVALILGVTANTVNSYIGNAMQKFGAANRAMAIATAIRTGAI